jgi:hypothetical protein
MHLRTDRRRGSRTSSANPAITNSAKALVNGKSAMSAIGPKRTFPMSHLMSAFGGQTGPRLKKSADMHGFIEEIWE